MKKKKKNEEKQKWDCSCWVPYPNGAHAYLNGHWKCVDDFECIRNYIPNKNWDCKTHCVRKEKNRGL